MSNATLFFRVKDNSHFIISFHPLGQIISQIETYLVEHRENGTLSRAGRLRHCHIQHGVSCHTHNNNVILEIFKISHVFSVTHYILLQIQNLLFHHFCQCIFLLRKTKQTKGCVNCKHFVSRTVGFIFFQINNNA